MPNYKNWIVMVYQAGNNNLSEEMVYALQEMRNIATTEDFKERAQVFSVFDPRGIEPRLYNFSQDIARVEHTDGDLESFKDPRSFVEELFKRAHGIYSNTIPQAAMARFKRFRERIFNNLDPEVVIGSLIQALPIDKTVRGAAHTMLVLSGHGSGALGDFLTGKEPGGRNIETSVTIPLLGRVLKSVAKRLTRKIDILGMDSCLMSNMEVAYEVSESVDFLVGAEGFERSIGWPYHRVLEAIAKTTPAPADFAQTIVERYTDFYRDYEVAGVSTDHSATDLRGFREKVRPVIESLVTELKRGLDVPEIKEAILLAHWEAQGYKVDEFVDLYDFCNRLLERCQAAQVSAPKPVADKCGKIIEACTKVKDIIEDDPKKSEPSKDGPQKVVLKSCFTGAAFQHSHGLSVYFPWAKFPDPLAEKPKNPEDMPESKVLRDYQKSLFAKETRWGTFLVKYLDVTRRDRRNQEHHQNERPKRFGPPDDSSLLVRTGGPGSARTGGPGSARTGGPGSARALSGEGTMKNPPDGFYPSKCTKS